MCTIHNFLIFLLIFASQHEPCQSQLYMIPDQQTIPAAPILRSHRHHSQHTEFEEPHEQPQLVQMEIEQPQEQQSSADGGNKLLTMATNFFSFLYRFHPKLQLSLGDGLPMMEFDISNGLSLKALPETAETDVTPRINYNINQQPPNGFVYNVPYSSLRNSPGISSSTTINTKPSSNSPEYVVKSNYGLTPYANLAKQQQYIQVENNGVKTQRYYTGIPQQFIQTENNGVKTQHYIGKPQQQVQTQQFIQVPNSGVKAQQHYTGIPPQQHVQTEQFVGNVFGVPMQSSGTYLIKPLFPSVFLPTSFNDNQQPMSTGAQAQWTNQIPWFQKNDDNWYLYQPETGKSDRIDLTSSGPKKNDRIDLTGSGSKIDKSNTIDFSKNKKQVRTKSSSNFNNQLEIGKPANTSGTPANAADMPGLRSFGQGAVYVPKKDKLFEGFSGKHVQPVENHDEVDFEDKNDYWMQAESRVLHHYD